MVIRGLSIITPIVLIPCAIALFDDALLWAQPGMVAGPTIGLSAVAWSFSNRLFQPLAAEVFKFFDLRRIYMEQPVRFD